MMTLLFSYSGLILIFLFVAISYRYSLNIYHFMYTHYPKQHNHQEIAQSPPKQSLIMEKTSINLDEIAQVNLESATFNALAHRPQVSPLLITEEELLANIEDNDLETEFQTKDNPFMLLEFYELILVEKLKITDKDFFNIMYYHMSRKYFHDIFRIEKTQKHIFDQKLYQILEAIQSSSNPNEEQEKKLYRLFKSSEHKCMDYEMDDPKPSSLFKRSLI